MRIEDRLFDRGWVRSAMATRKCGNIYFRKYFMAVRKFTNIFVLLLILMVGSRDTFFLVCFTQKNVWTDRQWLLPNVNRQKMSPPITKPVKKKVFMNGIRVWIPTALRNCPIHKCVNKLSIIALISILIAFSSHIIIYFSINRSCRS